MGRLNRMMREGAGADAMERIDRQCEAVLEAFRAPGPKSLVRAGDGEQFLLRDRHPIALRLAEAIRHADFFGLSDNPRGRDAVLRWLREHYQVEVVRPARINARIFRFAPELLGQLTAGKRVLWITADADVIVGNLGDPAFRDFYALHDIADNHSINTASGSLNNPLPKDISAEQAYADIRQQLTRAPDFDLACVGAGVVGKPVCHHIKTVCGKSAVDIGFMASALRGARDQYGLLARKGKLAKLVWDPAAAAG